MKTWASIKEDSIRSVQSTPRSPLVQDSDFINSCAQSKHHLESAQINIQICLKPSPTPQLHPPPQHRIAPRTLIHFVCMILSYDMNVEDTSDYNFSRRQTSPLLPPPKSLGRATRLLHPHRRPALGTIPVVSVPDNGPLHPHGPNLQDQFYHKHAKLGCQGVETDLSSPTELYRRPNVLGHC